MSWISLSLIFATIFRYELHPNYNNLGSLLNETILLSKKINNNTFVQSGFDDIHYCTNLKYDFEKSSWTDIDNEERFITDWKLKFGDFWNNYPHGYPVQLWV